MAALRLCFGTAAPVWNPLVHLYYISIPWSGAMAMLILLLAGHESFAMWRRIAWWVCMSRVCEGLCLTATSSLLHDGSWGWDIMGSTWGCRVIVDLFQMISLIGVILDPNVIDYSKYYVVSIPNNWSIPNNYVVIWINYSKPSYCQWLVITSWLGPNILTADSLASPGVSWPDESAGAVWGDILGL